jgi:hypothetical protein
MADETTLATARATDYANDEDTTKAELQRRMEQARETITQTVTEIKDTVANQYQSVKESINETLDWREQYRKRPVAFSVGALSVGFIVGYSIAGAVKGGGADDDDYRESDVWNVGAPLASGYAAARGGGASTQAARSYEAQPITGSAHSLTGEGEASHAPGYSSLAGASSAASGLGEAADADESKPGLLDRFKETKAFDRLQDEVSKLGDRFIEQLSTVGQDVVLPALFGKIKELFGVDLASRKQQEIGSGGAKASNAGRASASSSLADASRGSSQGTTGGEASAAAAAGGASYGTSENRAYGAETNRDDYGRTGSTTAATDPNRDRQ